MKARCLLALLVAGLMLMPFAVREARAAGPTDQLRGNVDRVLKLVADPVYKAPDKTKDRRR